MNDVQRFSELKEIIKQDSTNFQATREFIVLCLDFGYNEVALYHLNYLTKFFPNDANLYFNMGICYEKLKQLDFALYSYKKAVSLNKQEVDYTYNLACVYEDLNDFENAILYFKKSALLCPNDANIFFCIGKIYSKMDKSDIAIKCFLKAIKLNDDDYFAHFYLGQEYKKSGDLDSALIEYYNVTEIMPDYSWAYFNIAQIFYERGEIKEATKMLEVTIDKNNKDENAYKLLIQLALNDNDIKLAEKYTNSARENEVINGDLFYLMAKTYQMKNDDKNYQNCLKNALLNPDTLTYDSNSIKKELLDAKK